MAVSRRSEAQHGRGIVLLTKISDRPGPLARLLEEVAEVGANVVDVRHIREGLSLGMAETGVELILETRGAEHAEDRVRPSSDTGTRSTRSWSTTRRGDR